MKLVGAALFSVLLPSLAAAQGSGVFIQAGPFADALFAPTATGGLATGLLSSGPSGNPAYTWNDLNGDRRWQPGEETTTSVIFGVPSPDAVSPEVRRFAPGGSVAVGVFVTPSVSLRVEASFQGARVSTAESAYAFDSLRTVTRQESAVTDYFVAAGWHQGGSRRANITYIAGLAFQRQREESTITTAYQTLFRAADGRLVNSTPIEFDESFGSVVYNFGVMAGVDVPIRLSGNLAVVPQLRLVAVSHHWNLRPGVALRWNP